MNRIEQRKHYADLMKNRTDAAYEYYCSLSDEEKQLSEFTFACQIAKHLGLSISIARRVTANLIAEYHVEFIKNKHKAMSYGFTGHHHSAKVRTAISISTSERNVERAVMCKEQGLNYRNYKQDAIAKADANIDVADLQQYCSIVSQAVSHSCINTKIIV